MEERSILGLYGPVTDGLRVLLVDSQRDSRVIESLPSIKVPSLVLVGANDGPFLAALDYKVVIPAAMPSILAGLQLGMGVTIILIVAAEMIGGSSQSGMGYLLINSGQVMETEKVFASLVVLAVMGAGIIKLQQWTDRKLAPWVDRDDS